MSAPGTGCVVGFVLLAAAACFVVAIVMAVSS
jgi:hypothetical protein